MALSSLAELCAEQCQLKTSRETSPGGRSGGACRVGGVRTMCVLCAVRVLCGECVLSVRAVRGVCAVCVCCVCAECVC